jgi:hypothetical protein
MSQEAVPKKIRHWRGAQRQTGMARFSLLHGVKRKRPDCVDAKLIEVGSGCYVFLLHWCAHFTILIWLLRFM